MVGMINFFIFFENQNSFILKEKEVKINNYLDSKYVFQISNFKQ